VIPYPLFHDSLIRPPRALVLRREVSPVSKNARIALIATPVLLLLALLGYAMFSAWQVGQYRQQMASGTQTEASQGTTTPLNPTAPLVVAETLPPTGSGASRGTIIFDMAHSEVFGPQDQSELGQSKAVARMRAAGYAVRVNTDKFTKDNAIGDDVAAVFLPGPMVGLMDKERSRLDDFVRRGGTIVLTIHVPYPVLGMPTRYGLPVGTGVVADTGNQAGDQGVWVTDQIVADPLTVGVKNIQVVSGWPVSTEKSDIAEPRIVINSPKSAVVDSNADGAFTEKDMQPPYGMVGVADIGSGRVVVLGDDAIFANIAIDTNDNAKLLDNLLELISAPKPV